jgi:general secretion pathway protein F
MTAFRYKALNDEGKLVKGVLEGDSDRQVRGTLRQRHLRPVEVAEATNVSGAGEGRRLQWFAKRLGAGDLALLTRQLSTLVASALPLDECLQAVADQSRKPAIKSMMLQVRSKVAEGHTLAHALNQFPRAFGEMYRAMVNAGEEAGQLAPVLEQLAHYTETRQHTAQKLQMALIYPFVLIAVAVAVVSALMIFVVPELVGIFAHSKKALPPLTVGLIWVSDFMRAYALYCLILLVAAVMLSRRLLQHPGRRKRWHQFLLRVPGLRGVLVALDSARFASTLSILMASGVPVDSGSAHCGCCDDESGAPRGQRHSVDSGTRGGESQPSVVSGVIFPADDGAHGGFGGSQWRLGDHVGALGAESGTRT